MPFLRFDRSVSDGWPFKQGESIVAATSADLTAGMHVAVSFDGPAAESCPVQAAAGTVTIVE
jgi:hypothetical protein